MKRIALDLFPGLDWALQWISLGIEVVGVAIIVCGALVSTGVFLYRLAKKEPPADCYQRYRGTFGKAILLGL